MSLSVDIEKSLGSFRLRVRFTSSGGVLALLGASGCGKSMTLKCIAGIEKPDRGSIILDGVTLFDSQRHIDLTPQKRRVGYLFQQYALFPNMTVYQNIAAGVRSRNGRREAVAGMLRAMRLEGLEHMRPQQLSGGQQQRAALARILVNDPSALLLDEPFSALDSHLRFQMEQEVREVIRRFGKTVVLVSHDRDEVFRLSDDIAIMEDGAIQVLDNRAAVFADPVTKTGAMLTGCRNLSRFTRLGGSRVRALDWGMELELDRRPGDETQFLGIRTQDIRAGAGPNACPCHVVDEIENPFSYAVTLRPDGAEAAAALDWETDKAAWQALRGETVTVRLPAEAILLLKA